MREGNPPTKGKLGLEFGSDSMRLALTSNDQSHRLSRIYEVPMTSGCTETGQFEEPRAVAQCLRRLVATEKLGGIPTIFSVPNDKAAFTWASLPDLEGADLRDVAKYRVKKSGSSPDDLLVAVAKHGNDSNQSLIVGVPRALAAERVDIIEKAGLRPAGAEAEAQALLRAVENSFSHRSALLADSSITIVQIGRDRTHFIVVQSGRLNFVRTVKTGYRKFEEAVEKALRVDETTARNLLYDPKTWIVDNRLLQVCLNGEHLSVELAEPIESLVKEFRRLLNYFRNLHPDRSYSGVFDRLVFIGRLGVVKGFCEGIEDLLSVRTEALNPLAGCAMDTDTASFRAIQSKASRFALAIGLAQAPYASIHSKEERNDDRFFWRRNAA